MSRSLLYYYGARFFDPELGRFITVDPAMDGMNWFVCPRGILCGRRTGETQVALLFYGKTTVRKPF